MMITIHVADSSIIIFIAYTDIDRATKGHKDSILPDANILLYFDSITIYLLR